jgi:phosphosulfolactate phosphohydrolase-like enzyme
VSFPEQSDAEAIQAIDQLVDKILLTCCESTTTKAPQDFVACLFVAASMAALCRTSADEFAKMAHAIASGSRVSKIRLESAVESILEKFDAKGVRDE